jgi:hypothetical protein
MAGVLQNVPGLSSNLMPTRYSELSQEQHHPYPNIKLPGHVPNFVIASGCFIKAVDLLRSDRH